jgi:TonB family protein
MSTLLLYLAFTLGVQTAAEITLPTPPKAPELPRVEGAVGKTTISAEQLDTFTATIVQLDSLRTLENDLKSKLAGLKTEQSEIREKLIPATRLKRIYLQSEVDHKAYSIRRSLPSMTGRGDITVRFIVNPEGHTEEIEVISPTGVRGEPVRETVSRWLYGPARKSNQRVPVRITVSARMNED